MQRLFCAVLAFLLLFSVAARSAYATEEKPTFSFELSVDGKEVKEVRTGDIITVVLRLQRTDSDEHYTMYAMQDEIRYDSEFFEIVEGSTMLSTGIISTDIAMVDQYREFYMNYLSMSGGAQWDADMLIGSFQLRVIAETGVTKITNQDYLVSLQDGSGSYACEANELTIVLSTDCTVRFMTNGGTAVEDRIVPYGEKIPRPEDPVREGYTFAGWYKDIHLTKKWDFESDTVQGNMSLYAKWQTADVSDDTNPSEGDNICMWWLLILLIAIAYAIMKYRKKREPERNTHNA